MVHDSTSYFVDNSFESIYYGKGLYHRLHLVSTDPRWHPAMYLRDDKLKEYTKAEVKAIYDKFVGYQKESNCVASYNPGEIIVRDEGAFIRCLKNGEMIGFLDIPKRLMDDLKDRLTAEFITNAAKEIFEQDADFGLYYCGSLCPPEANFADYYYNWNGLEIRAKKVEEAEDQSLEEKNKKLQESLSKTEKALREKEMTLQQYQKSLQHMAKDNQCLQEKVKMLEKEQSRLLKEMNQLLVEKNRTLEEEVKTLKEQQLKKTAEETTV